VIRKLLIANRGEIACRVIATCRRMGIVSVAVYSEADKDALHVRQADEAVHIGPADAASSYLSADAIIAATKATGAEAIHPGYGFLSERALLPQLCEKNGIIWVGPSADTIERMGSKIESKHIAEKAGVASVPGYHGADQGEVALMAAAKKIGYPVLIKASAGGGGRGMRRVEQDSELKAALEMARREAQAGFGDPRLLIEKLIQRPRHLEVQILGDKHGGLLHLFERECSVQRNFQKVVEEAPAPRLTDKTRKRLFDAALELGQAIKYDSAGTVEFILEEGDEQPYFLEMNTRLQVEHPVTELITGLDLVELQIRVAAGEPLPLTQEQITFKGSAIEVRVNAENPAAGYRPNVGSVLGVRIPEGDGIRIDTGIAEGSEVTPHYDSMLAKVIAYGADRAMAARRLATALGTYAVFGVGTNQGLLRDIITHPKFLAGELTTRFIEEAFPDGWNIAEDSEGHTSIAAAAIWAMTIESRAVPPELGPFLRLGAFRVLERAGRPALTRLTVEQSEAAAVIELTGRCGSYDVAVNGAVRKVRVQMDDADAAVSVDGMSRRYGVHVKGDEVGLSVDGAVTIFRVAPEIESAGAGGGAAAAGGPRLAAPMPGLVNAVQVEVGQDVAQGDIIVMFEAMKLMMSLAAPVSGRVAEIFCKAGETVSAGAALVDIEPAESA
jgi:3-methylcrotonyl-CoA carboxylase alpha subunit